jgi:hypothetical protein
MSSIGGHPKRAMYNIYTSQLRKHALSLLWLGYKRLKPTTFAKSEEDDITGELTKEMNNVLEDYNSPRWVEHYSVPEQVRVNVRILRGKSRPLIDVKIVRHKRGKRPHLPFEAKRLGRGSSAGDYLGLEGLGAFLDGTYPTTHSEAGMLGYIQENSESDWAIKISARILKTSRSYKVAPNGQWIAYKCNQPPSNTFQTIHYDHAKKQIIVIHVLLLFH